MAKSSALLEALPALRMRYLLDKQYDGLPRRQTSAPLWTPQPGPQTLLVESEADEILFGGSPGGGKTDGLLGLAVTRHTRSHIFRRDAGQLTEMTDRLREIIAQRGRVTESPRPRWRDGHRLIELAGVENEADAWKWQGRAGDLKAFDELTQFSKTKYLTVSGWGRSTVAGQKVQTVGTCNPPVDEDALWIVERWGAWLDPTHPNPAASGEIRWFAMIDGADTECEDGDPFPHGEETVYPSSRTFIRSSLSDNAYLGDEYRRRLDALPEPMRTIFKTSDFMALLQTSHPFQVIPTDWIRQAQKRWTPDPPELPNTTRRVPQSCISLDVAEGGKDRTVTVSRHGDWLGIPRVKPGIETPEAEDSVAFVEPELIHGGYVIVDADGAGGKAYGILRAKFKTRARLYQGVRPTLWRDSAGVNEFRNVRAAAHWCARQALDPENPRKIALPPGNDVLTELAAPRWFMAGQRIQIEKKEDTVSRLGRSPDVGDAIIMSLWEGGSFDVPDSFEIKT